MKAGRYKPLLMMFLVAGSMTIGAKLPQPVVFGTTFTFQTFFLCLTALYFKPIEAGIGQILYIVTGFFAPVFASDYIGWAVMNGSSAGYIYAFPIAAFVLSKYGKSGDWFAVFSWTVMAHFIILLGGMLWLMFKVEMDASRAMTFGFMQLLPGALAKGGLATLIYFIGEKFLRKSQNEV